MGFINFLESDGESVAQMKARLKELERDLADMSVTPTSQKVADAIDSARDEVKDLRARIKKADGIKESAPEAQSAYQTRVQQAQGLILEISQLLRQHVAKQKQSPDNWGYAGDMAHATELLTEVVTFLKGDK